MEKTQASDEVVEFIRRRFKNKDRWMDGWMEIAISLPSF